MSRPEEVARYAARCREMSQDGEYQWWGRLADILDALPAALLSAKREGMEEAAKIAETHRHPRGTENEDARWCAGTASAASSIRAKIKEFR